MTMEAPGPWSKPPFDTSRAKSTAYQTGVWVPGFVAGPEAKKGRQVKAMVNIADLFQLFGELAGIDVHASVPAIVDAESIAAVPEASGSRAAFARPTTPSSGPINMRMARSTDPASTAEASAPRSRRPRAYARTTTASGGAPVRPTLSTAGIPADGFKLCCEVAKWQADHPSMKPMVTQIYPLEAKAIRNENLQTRS